jgi:GGDEF domain-containing protein
LVVDAASPDIERVSQRIAAAFRDPFSIDGHCLRLGVSVGRALYPLDGEDPDDLLRHADAAMFVDKRAHQARPLMLQQRQATG